MTKIIWFEHTTWYKIAAVVIWPLWILFWRKYLIGKFEDWGILIFGRDADHEAVVELQVKLYTKLIYYISFIPMFLIIFALLGLFTDRTSFISIGLGSGFLAVIGFASGSTIIKHTFSGIRVLLTEAFGKGQFIKAVHPHEGAEFEGWVKEVKVYASFFLSPDLTEFIVSNELLMEYRIENLDRSPFYYEKFFIEIENATEYYYMEMLKDRVILDPTMNSLIAITTFEDRGWYEKVFANIDDNVWQAIRAVSIIRISLDMAVLRIPAKNYSTGQALRHVIYSSKLLKEEEALLHPRPKKETVKEAAEKLEIENVGN